MSTKAGHRDIVSRLLKAHASVDKKDSEDRTALMAAAFMDHWEIVELLLDHGAEISDSLGRTPLMLAASQGQLDAVDLLTKNGAYIDCIDSDGRTAFQLAAIHGHLPVVDILLALGADEAHKDNDGAVALHYAVAHGDVTLCKALATSVTVRATDRAGNHPLINACQGDNEEVVQELINLGADVEQLSLNGHSALRVAALSGNTKIVRLLAEHITDWEQQDMDGTPLVHTLLINKQTAMAELLLTLGAFISARDAHGRTCAHV
ncbi:ankyrin repeat protein, partial [Teladorsagia circumcincta]